MCACCVRKKAESFLVCVTDMEKGHILKRAGDMQVTVKGSVTGIKGKVKGQECVSRENVNSRKVSTCVE